MRVRPRRRGDDPLDRRRIRAGRGQCVDPNGRERCGRRRPGVGRALARAGLAVDGLPRQCRNLPPVGRRCGLRPAPPAAAHRPRRRKTRRHRPLRRRHESLVRLPRSRCCDADLHGVGLHLRDRDGAPPSRGDATNESGCEGRRLALRGSGRGRCPGSAYDQLAVRAAQRHGGDRSRDHGHGSPPRRARRGAPALRGSLDHRARRGVEHRRRRLGHHVDPANPSDAHHRASVRHARRGRSREHDGRVDRGRPPRLRPRHPERACRRRGCRPPRNAPFIAAAETRAGEMGSVQARASTDGRVVLSPRHLRGCIPAGAGVAGRQYRRTACGARHERRTGRRACRRLLRHPARDARRDDARAQRGESDPGDSPKRRRLLRRDRAARAHPENGHGPG